MGYETDFLPADKHKNFLQIDSITLGVHGQVYPKHIYLQYLKKKVKDGVEFSLLKIVKRFFKLILSFLMCVTRHVQITQITQVDFLPAGRHENLLQIDTMILMWIVKHFQSSQNSKFIISVQYVKKEVRDEDDFLHADKHQIGLQVDFNTFGTKFGYKMIL